jgi:signal transduction histidine kinase
MSIVTTEGSSLVSYKAIHGLQGPTEGTDYRGVPVQAVIRWVSGSNWYLIVKIDEEEIANATWSVSRYVLVLMLSVALLLSGWIVQRWYRQSARFVAERDRLRSRLLKAQELESVALLAGGVAHDFNNMLAGISGFAEVLQKGLPDGSLRGAAEKILDSTRRGAYVVQGLLAFSRQQRLREETIALNRLVLERRGDLEKMMGPTIEFRVDLSADEIVVRGDSDHLGQILTILAENSKEAMSGGGLFTIRTEARTLKEEILSTHGTKVSGPHACIVVSDTGKGMDEATQKRIFEPFFTTKEFGRNAGLGLAAVYGMMRQHDGFIDVKSAPSRGTTMTLLLPLTGGV